MKIVIIEDEKLAADNLELMLNQVEPSFEIIAKLESVRQSIDWLSQNSADLLFVDIMLADGNSFQIFEKINITTPVIFTTAYDQYAIKAFKLYSIAYLLKPINIEELTEAVQKFHTIYQNQTIAPDWEQLLSMIKNPVVYQSRFLIHAGSKIKTVKIAEIAYFQVKEGNTFLGTFDNHFYDVNYTLEQLENILDPKIFFRINRQFIINIEAIQHMHTVSKSRIKLEMKPQPDEETIVSVNNVAAFRKWLNK